MGIGMQIAYLGFPGEARIEAEAGVQLLRLMRFARSVSGCHLAIEMLHGPNGEYYDVRLDLVSAEKERIPLAHCSEAEPEAAVRAVFDQAERELCSRNAVLSRLNG